MCRRLVLFSYSRVLTTLADVGHSVTNHLQLTRVGFPQRQPVGYPFTRFTSTITRASIARQRVLPRSHIPMCRVYSATAYCLTRYVLHLVCRYWRSRQHDSDCLSHIGRGSLSFTATFILIECTLAAASTRRFLVV